MGMDSGLAASRRPGMTDVSLTVEADPTESWATLTSRSAKLNHCTHHKQKGPRGNEPCGAYGAPLGVGAPGPKKRIT
jgi:hypothetical protein